MQERWSTSNAKLVQVEGGLPQEECYFPEKNDENPKKNYVKSVLCTKVFLFLLLLCLVGLSSYLIWQTPQRSVDDNNEDVSQSEKLFGSIEQQSTPGNVEDSSPWLEARGSEYDGGVTNETQHDDLVDDSDSASEEQHSTPTADVVEENLSETFSKSERLRAFMKQLMPEIDFSPDAHSSQADIVTGSGNLQPADRDVVSFLIKVMLAETVVRMAESKQREEDARNEETTEIDLDASDSAMHFDHEDYDEFSHTGEHNSFLNGNCIGLRWRSFTLERFLRTHEKEEVYINRIFDWNSENRVTRLLLLFIQLVIYSTFIYD